jgi:hypothetical protein
MTCTLFEEFLNSELAARNGNILLLVDDCAAHPKNVAQLFGIFASKHVISVMQPMDKGVTEVLKHHL